MKERDAEAEWVSAVLEAAALRDGVWGMFAAGSILDLSSWSAAKDNRKSHESLQPGGTGFSGSSLPKNAQAEAGATSLRDQATFVFVAT
jgi:hypothetical protein